MDTASTTPSVSHSPVTTSVDTSSAPMIAPVITDTGAPAKKSWSSVIAIVLILAAIIIGAFYAWGQRIAQMQPIDTTVTS